MSKRIIILIVLALAMIAAFVAFQSLRRADAATDGEVTFKTKSGDLVKFMLDGLTRYGGTVTITGTLPTMRAEWRYAEDAEGFQIFFYRRARKMSSFAASHRRLVSRCVATYILIWFTQRTDSVLALLPIYKATRFILFVYGRERYDDT